jgi:hypothetical protein
MSQRTNTSIGIGPSIFLQQGKLKSFLQYLYGNPYMKLNLFANNLTTIPWWVDASHALLMTTAEDIQLP